MLWMKKWQSILLMLQMMILETSGDLTGWLDSISPEQYVDVVENPDGGYTVFWKIEPEKKEET